MTIRKFCALIVCGTVMASGQLRAAVIDDFTSTTASDKGNYTFINVSSDTGGGISQFNNSGGYFQPTAGTPTTSTAGFLRNTGEQANAGDSVSIDVNIATLTSTTSNCGLVFDTSLTDPASETQVFFGHFSGTTYRLYLNSTTIYSTYTLTGSATGNFTIDVTLTGSNGYSAAVSSTTTTGSTLSGTAGTGTFHAAGAQYFGPEVFNSSTIQMTNLTYVPEPASLGTLSLAAMGLLVRRRRMCR